MKHLCVFHIGSIDEAAQQWMMQHRPRDDDGEFPRAVATHEAGAPPHEIHSATARAAGGGSHQQHVRAWEQVGGVHDRVRSVQGRVRIADPRPGVRVCPRRRARQRNSSGCGTRGAHGGGVLGRESRGHVDAVHTCRSTQDGGGRSARRLVVGNKRVDDGDGADSGRQDDGLCQHADTAETSCSVASPSWTARWRMRRRWQSGGEVVVTGNNI